MSDEGSQSSRKSSKKPKYSRFSQQELPAYKPILTPRWVITSFILVGVVFIPVGLASLSAADQVEEILERYDDKCSPFTDEKETLEYIESNTTNKTCTRSLTVRKKMKNPVFIYYQLDNFYQNHRRYVKSRNVKQLRIPTEAGYQKDCDPIASSENPIIPCGLIAWSLFNDTYRFSVKDKVLEVDKKDIAWRSDKEYKFGSQVYPKNFQSGGIMSIGGGKLDASLPLSEQEDLIVWMRTAALPTFRKLYGKITVDLEANDNITVVIENNYNTYKYGGQKVLVLSTTSWMGGKNHFLGRAYLTIGGLSLVIAICFIIMYLVRPRPLGDPAYLSPIRWSLVCGLMLFALGLISLFTGHVTSDLEWYSQRLVKRSWYYKLDGARAPVDIWKSEFSKFYYGCSERGPHLARAVRERLSNGYLLIAASGGLNQQRTGITDAVVVARILNATLVVPELDHNSFWKDNSDFLNIFDVDWFISSLSKDVTIVKRVPDKVMRSMEKPPYTMRVPRKSEPDYYLDEVLPILLRRRVVQLTKFDYRLANELEEELQKLRCRVNYHALRFTKPIRSIGQKVVMRMRKMAKRFIAVHLRFEPDMLAFSGCYYGGGDKERYELGEIRKRWVTLPETTPDEERKRGKCPLTPHEVGLMLRALGFKNDTFLYVASGEIYGGEETLRPLRELFPNFYTKEILVGDQLQPFLAFSSRLAAIDYIVCDESDVFITNNNGNMAKILAGQRRYMGHKRTIRPNAKRLSAIFMARGQMGWDTFARKVKSCQRGFMGEPEEMRLGRGEFHEYPSSCICKKPFKYSRFKSNYNRDRLSSKIPIVPETRAEYEDNGDYQSAKTQRLNNTSTLKMQVSLTEEADDDDFLTD